MRIRSWFFIGILGLFILFNGCNKPVPMKEAEKQLKAFDNELIMIYEKLSDSESSKILKQLLLIKDLPIPLVNLVQSNATGPSIFEFEKHTGVYKVDEENNVKWISPSDSIIVIFNYLSKNDSVAYLELTNFSEEITKWGSTVPTKLFLKVKASGVVLFEINLKGEVKHNIPTKMDMLVKLDKYSMQLRLRSVLNKRKARFYVRLNLSTPEKKIIDADIFMKHNVTNPDQSVLETTKVRWKTFPVDLFVVVDNKSFNPASTNFIEEFNKCSIIKINSQLGGNLLGEVKLAERRGEGKLNYMITYNDGRIVFLEDLLLSYKHLMNARFPAFLSNLNN